MASFKNRSCAELRYFFDEHTCFWDIFTSQGDICGQWNFSMTITLTDLDVLPCVYLFLQSGSFTFQEICSRKDSNKYAMIQEAYLLSNTLLLWGVCLPY